MHAFSYKFFSLQEIFFISPIYKGQFVHKNYALKTIGHGAYSRAEDH